MSEPKTITLQSSDGVDITVGQFFFRGHASRFMAKMLIVFLQIAMSQSGRF